MPLIHTFNQLIIHKNIFILELLSTKSNFGIYSEYFLPKAVFHLFFSKKKKAHKGDDSMFLIRSI